MSKYKILPASNVQDETYVPSCEYAYGVHYYSQWIGNEWKTARFMNRAVFMYEQGNQSPITIYNYRALCNRLTPKNNFYTYSDFTNRHRHLLNGFSESDFHTSVYDAYCEEFNNDVEWIWGNIEDGGCYVIKCANEPIASESDLYYRINVCYGIYQYDESPNNYYLATGNVSNKIPIYGMERIGWYLLNKPDYIDQGLQKINHYSYLSFFWSQSPIDWYYVTMGNSPITTLPEQATNDVRYVPYATGDIVGTEIMIPVKTWYWEGGSANGDHDFSVYQPSDATQVTGEDLEELDIQPTPTASSVGGGYGTPETNSDDIEDEDIDDLNQLTAINSGLVTLFNPTMSELSSFSNWLYTGITDPIADQLKRLVSNPLEYIIFVAMCKFQPPVDQTREEIAFCGIGSNVYSDKISQQFVDIDCGTININEQWQSFLDYEPHSKIKIHLPFVGTHELQMDDFMSGQIGVKYRIDLLSGCCVAKVKVKRVSRKQTDPAINSILYQFDGNVYLTMPLSASDWRGAYSSLVNFAGGVVQGMAGNTMGAVGSIASAITSQKVSVSRSGQTGSAYGYIGQNKPYLILERPIQSVPENWGAFEGYTSNIKSRVSDLEGYTEVDDNTIWTNNFGKATQEECDMIKDIMIKGVYL